MFFTTSSFWVYTDMEPVSYTHLDVYKRQEIDKMIKDAEMNAEADKKRKEEVDIRNNADAMVFQVEKTLKDMGDKADAAEVADINKAKDELKKALEGNDTAEIKAKTEALQEVLYKMTEKMYAAAQAAQQAQGGAEAQGQDVYKRQESSVRKIVSKD